MENNKTLKQNKTKVLLVWTGTGFTFSPGTRKTGQNIWNNNVQKLNTRYHRSMISGRGEKKVSSVIALNYFLEWVSRLQCKKGESKGKWAVPQSSWDRVGSQRGPKWSTLQGRILQMRECHRKRTPQSCKRSPSSLRWVLPSVCMWENCPRSGNNNLKGWEAEVGGGNSWNLYGSGNNLHSQQPERNTLCIHGESSGLLRKVSQKRYKFALAYGCPCATLTSLKKASNGANYFKITE